ncbi:hypothetical protein RHMOL_Rhmol03G0219900 [Rhododendron molle]|uniref:Uncharacterized protein n=1 Tax=Rhododendron molle TaxID=49168 RepID=A0ACC0PJD4_RHOML|nr:hypothetical protein RHMOL_Rhmol03G0219900 [Rhododendron molle]
MSVELKARNGPPSSNGGARKAHTNPQPFILHHNPHHHRTTPAPPTLTSSASPRPLLPYVHFHHTTISPPFTTSSDNFVALAFELPRLYNSNLHHALQTMISRKSRPKASIIDLFWNSSFEVFTSLDIPTYCFFTSCACSLSAILSLPKTHQILLEKIKDPNTSIEFPGVPPIPTPDLPGPFFDTEGLAYKSFFGTAINMAKSAGILINTCHAFEPRAVKAISDGLCTPKLPTPYITLLYWTDSCEQRRSGPRTRVFEMARVASKCCFSLFC